MSKFEDLKKQIDKARNEAKEKFGDMFSELFEKYPKLESIGWTQYTPYFNDGDVCKFGVHYEYNQYINGECTDDFYEYNDHGDSKVREDFPFTTEELDDISNIVCELVGEFDADDLEYMFGEGLVIINRDGLIEVECCDHD